MYFQLIVGDLVRKKFYASLNQWRGANQCLLSCLSVLRGAVLPPETALCWVYASSKPQVEEQISPAAFICVCLSPGLSPDCSYPWEAIICLTFWRQRIAGNLRYWVVVQSLSHVQRCVTWTSAHQAPLASAVSQSLLKLLSLESVTPSHRLILCCPLPLLFSVFPSIRVFSNESTHNECAAQILARE